MAIDSQMNVKSILGLIASDFSYKQKAFINEHIDHLETFPDSKVGEDASFPSSLSLALGREELTRFESFERDGLTGVRLTNWKVVRSFETQGDGFGAVVFRSTVRGQDGKYDYIVALRGTDGLDPQDWFANLDLAATVWGEHPEIVTYLTSLQTIDGELDKPSLNRIHFTGQSLGGALAQYAAYDFALAVRDDADVDIRKSVTITTFNSFGGVRGLQILGGRDGRPTEYDPLILENVATAHYSIDNDLVHRLGKGTGNVLLVGGSWHVNGAGNTYRFPFRRFDNRGVPIPGPKNFLGIVESHRIESGFYAGFERTSDFKDFTNTRPYTIDYLDSENSRTLGAALSRVGNKGFTTETSATVRLVVGAAAIGVVGNPIEIEK